MILEYHRIQRSDGQCWDYKLFNAAIQMLDLRHSALEPPKSALASSCFTSMHHRPFCFRSVTNLDIQRTEETHASPLIIHANHNSRSLWMIFLGLLVLVVLILFTCSSRSFARSSFCLACLCSIMLQITLLLIPRNAIVWFRSIKDFPRR